MDRHATVAHGLSRRCFLQGSAALAGLGLVSGCGLMPLQPQPAKVRRIGHLMDSDGIDETQEAPFRDRLRELGYVQGENLVIEHRFARNDPTRLPSLIAELETAGVEAIVCGGLVSCLAMKQADSPIPTVVWSPANDVITTGLVQNIARPEGNITGIAGLPGFSLNEKQLELLHAAVPDAGRVGLLAPVNWPVRLQAWKDAASRLGLDVHPDVVTVQGPGGIEAAVSTLKVAAVGAVVIIPGTMLIEDEVRSRLVERLRAYRLPSVAPIPAFSRDGGLLAYSPDRTDSAYRVAWYVDRLLKGAKPADLPMERPSKFDFVINLKTAQALGLTTIPPEVLAQATEIIQ
jgi:putative ABC transport system substrate-binding protein